MRGLTLSDKSEKTNTIQVTARFFGAFKQVTEKRDIEIFLVKGSTITNLIGKTIAIYPPLQRLLLDNNLQLGSWVVILINGRNMGVYDGLATKLNDGDVISIFPPVAGG